MVLVTGGSGFIGAAVTHEIIGMGRKAVVFSRTGKSERLAGIENSIEIIKGDISDFPLLLKVIKNYDISCIIHMAFFTDIQQLEASPQKGIDINCKGFLNILEAARSSGIERVVWTSSAAVYGETDRYGQLPVNEEAPFYPLNVYGQYKAWCEWMGGHYHNKLGVRNISLRPTIVFGSGRWFRGSAAYAYDLFHGPASGKPVVLEWGDQLVDWIYVKDLARAIVLAGTLGKLNHRTFNICGHRATVADAAEMVKKLEPLADIKVLSGKRPMWVPYLDMTRSENELGYRPSYSLEDAFSEYMKEIKESYSERGIKEEMI